MKAWEFWGQKKRSPFYRWFEAQRRELNRWLVGYFIDRAHLQPTDSVLEAGSGTAYASALMVQEKRAGLSVALDMDPEPLRLAQQSQGKLPAVQGDLHRLPFGKEAFHLVWNSSTLEHLENPFAALAEMARVTRKGGHVFIGVPHRWGAFGFQPWIAKTPLGNWIGPVFSAKELEQLIVRAGLTPVETRTYWHFRSFIGILAKKG